LGKVFFLRNLSLIRHLMTGHLMTGKYFPQRWRFVAALLGCRLGKRTALSKPTTRRRIDRTGRIALQVDPATPLCFSRPGGRHCGKQSPGVRVKRTFKQRYPVGLFHDFSGVHDRNLITYVLDDA
jgi:hypothetical protein